MSIPKVKSLVVDQDLCTGCGICITQCDNNALSMDWNNEGFLIPKQIDECHEDATCINVCPFNPSPKPEVKTEDEIATIFQKNTSNFEPSIGKYENTYVGYSIDYRSSSSSGGMATYYFEQILKRKIADHIIVVNYNKDEGPFYQYQLIQSPQDLKKSSKTRYYPVSMDQAIKAIKNIDGKVAVVGVGCFIKAIRLLQVENAFYKSKISFLIGIICGGLKSKYYTDYLSSKAVNTFTDIKNPQYRIKDKDSLASDYYFGVEYKKELHTLRMKSVGDMWGTGYFKSNACDFCEDVTTELADVSLGDAWLSPYVEEGNGNSIIITRNAIADDIISNGLLEKKLKLTALSIDGLKQSQRGSYNHRHKGLKFRIALRKRKNLLTPPKRERNLGEISLAFKIVQLFRKNTRKESINNWLKVKRDDNFDRLMKKHLLYLRIATKIYHISRKLGWKEKK